MVGVDVDYLSTNDGYCEGDGDDDGDGDVDVDYISTSSAAPSFIALKSQSRFDSIQL